MSDFWLYLKLGLGHVLDLQAYDHVLFLVVLTVGYQLKDWKRVLFLVTIFTLGHTFSLLLATFDIVQVNKKLVEFLIPGTIFVAAMQTLFTSGKSTGRAHFGFLMVITACFGLVHGLGFSNYFTMIHSGSASKWIGLSGFTSGIELAQMVVVGLLLVLGGLLQTLFRFPRRDWVLVVTAMAAGIAIPMLLANRFW